jgi:membrane-associated phospholipid phosphatase
MHENNYNMKNLFLISLCFSIVFSAKGQDTSPYKLRWAVDLPAIIAGAGLSYAGLQVLRDKPYLDSAEVAGLKQSDVNRFDRGATRHYDANASNLADFSLYASFAAPALLLLNKPVRKDFLKVTVLYIETMGVMGVAYTWIVGNTHRIRPYVYNPDVPFQKKLGRGTTNSFYAGHPASAAAATFFVAKVFADYNPDSKLKPFIWTAAVIPPAIVAYFRYRRGQHFPTDILVGIPLGAFIGIIVPQLHRRSNKTNLSIVPSLNGLSMTYTFRR